MTINRRRFVKTLASSSAGKLLLGPAGLGLTIGSHDAAADASDAKFISFITPIGHHPDWWPTGSGGAYELGAVANSLSPYKNQIAYLSGTQSVLKHFSGSGAHKAGFPAATTGHVDINKDPSPSTGVSIDQHLLNGWKNGKGLPLGVRPAGNYKSIISWKKANQGIAPNGNARTVFDSLFANLNDGSANADQIRAQNKSILDTWTNDIKRLQASLSEDHRQALEAHLTYVKEMEEALNKVPSAECKPGKKITNPNSFYTNNANFPAIGKQMMDLIALAFSCGEHRVASLVWSAAGSGVNHTAWAKTTNAGHHAITHSGKERDPTGDVFKIDEWYTKQFAYLIKRLKESPDGVGGNLLDSTLIYWSTETGRWNSHSGANIGVLIAGNYQNQFNVGRAYNFKNTPMNNILAEIANGLGVPTEKFGNPEFATGGLSQIRR